MVISTLRFLWSQLWYNISRQCGRHTIRQFSRLSLPCRTDTGVVRYPQGCSYLPPLTSISEPKGGQRRSRLDEGLNSGCVGRNCESRRNGDSAYHRGGNSAWSCKAYSVDLVTRRPVMTDRLFTVELIRKPDGTPLVSLIDNLRLGNSVPRSAALVLSIERARRLLRDLQELLESRYSLSMQSSVLMWFMILAVGG